MTFLAILIAVALVLNVLLVIATVRSISDVQHRQRDWMEMDADWRDMMTERMERLERRVRNGYTKKEGEKREL